MDTTSIVKGAFSLLGEIAPQTMAGVALRLFTRPRRFAPPPRERLLRDEAERSMVDTPVGPVAVLTWSTAELPWEPRQTPRGTALLMHGWQGRGSQLCAFVEPLLALGFRVVAFDGPAHGDSPGDTADALVFSIALRAVAEHVGDVRAVLAHSMGGAAANVAIGDGLDVEAVVLLAPPSTVDLVTDDFASQLHLTPRTRSALRRKIARRFHVYAWNRLGMAPVGGRTDVAPTLIVHDEDDDEVPLVRGKALANAWPGARLHVTSGLGHRRILRDPDVVSHVCSFIDRHVRVPGEARQVGGEVDTTSVSARH